MGCLSAEGQPYFIALKLQKMQTYRIKNVKSRRIITLKMLL